MDLYPAALVLVIIMDPVGNIPVFQALLGPLPPRRRVVVMPALQMLLDGLRAYPGP